MAGGFSRRGGGTPLGERTRGPVTQLHGSIEGMRRPPGPDPMTVIDPSPALRLTPTQAADHRDVEPTHVWVTTDAGQVPGLLVGWRRLPTGQWEASTWLPAARVGPI